MALYLLSLVDASVRQARRVGGLASMVPGARSMADPVSRGNLRLYEASGSRLVSPRVWDLATPSQFAMHLGGPAADEVTLCALVQDIIGAMTDAEKQDLSSFTAPGRRRVAEGLQCSVAQVSSMHLTALLHLGWIVV